MRVITLCGSTKFKRQFEQVNAYLTLKGNIVISLAFFEQSEGIELTTEQAELLGDLHFKKIDLSDEIFVIDVGGYYDIPLFLLPASPLRGISINQNRFIVLKYSLKTITKDEREGHVTGKPTL